MLRRDLCRLRQRTPVRRAAQRRVAQREQAAQRRPDHPQPWVDGDAPEGLVLPPELWARKYRPTTGEPSQVPHPLNGTAAASPVALSIAIAIAIAIAIVNRTRRCAVDQPRVERISEGCGPGPSRPHDQAAIHRRAVKQDLAASAAASTTASAAASAAASLPLDHQPGRPLDDLDARAQHDFDSPRTQRRERLLPERRVELRQQLVASVEQQHAREGQQRGVEAREGVLEEIGELSAVLDTRRASPHDNQREQLLPLLDGQPRLAGTLEGGGDSQAQHLRVGKLLEKEAVLPHSGDRARARLNAGSVDADIVLDPRAPAAA